MKNYQERDIMLLDEQGDYYIRHMMALTAEDLQSKSDIAAELAHRDYQIDELKKDIEQYHKLFGRLFCKVNKVTAPFRHHGKERITDKALVALANYQIEAEEQEKLLHE